jgi:hypothetical protein
MTTFPHHENRARPRSPPHRFFAARAKPIAPRTSTRTTTWVGVFIIVGEPPQDTHTITQVQEKEIIIAGPRRSPPLPRGK